MNIVIIHHHLKTGGVTKIIHSQIEALKKFNDIKLRIITGSIPKEEIQNFSGIEITSIPEFDYIYEHDTNEESVLRLYKYYTNALPELISKEEIIHIHNINLGKNPVLTVAISDLVDLGYEVFHHCHDFSEDRPSNYGFMQLVVEKFLKKNLEKIMYPKCTNYHIGTLNNTDLERLENILPKSNLHLLPNPVNTNVKTYDKTLAKESICKQLGIRNSKKKLIVYPVRAITRKNLGEFVLLALIFEKEAIFINTLSPKNEQELIQYKNWVVFCKSQSISILFEAGTLVDFEELLSAADLCITTSYMEGFGMVYLEPWLFGTPVVGRNLENITHDLKKYGICFPYLYKNIIIDNDKEFSTLTLTEQQEYIVRVKEDEETKSQFLSRNKFLLNLLSDVDRTIIDQNIQTIKNTFSIDKYGDKLHGIYRRLSEES